jgi:hypothetical protein
MKVIMELDSTSDIPGLSGKQVKHLRSYGVADTDVLEVCWKEFISAVPNIEIRHLCLMLQAYCLIYPIKMVISRGKEKPHIPQYIIPCKFPAEIESRVMPAWVEKCATFYFDFDGFLPEVIYHRLVCLASNISKLPSSQLDQKRYSRKMCLFYKILETNWVIEMERRKQRLKIRVVM